MNYITAPLKLPEGNFFSSFKIFENSDIVYLRNIYINWRNLCNQLSNMDYRTVNLPEGLSGPAFCLAKDFAQIDNKSMLNGNTSFDFYDFNAPVGKNRIVMKSCSVRRDLSSFGPTTIWDRIFFVDFFREGHWDGSFDIYELVPNDIRTPYFIDLQQQGRRPRLSIYDTLISKGKYLSKQTCNLFF